MGGSESSRRNSEREERPRLTPWPWFERVIAGLFWGWVWSSLVAGGWLGLAALAYGDISRASEIVMRKAWGQYAVSALMVSMLGSFVGGFVGPLSIGAGNSRVRQPVLLSSLSGAASGGCDRYGRCLRHGVDFSAMRSPVDARDVVGPRRISAGWPARWLARRASCSRRPVCTRQSGRQARLNCVHGLPIAFPAGSGFATAWDLTLVRLRGRRLNFLHWRHQYPRPRLAQITR